MERETANLSNLPQIEIDYSEEGYPEKARKLKPHVFKDEESYYCLFGPDPQVGIFGRGDTPLEAIEDWESDLEQRIIHIAEGDAHSREASQNLLRE
jgi:hypothetical protein